MKPINTISTLEILTSTHVREIKESETDRTLVIEGLTKTSETLVTITLRFQIAPSLQSMLSRLGKIYISSSITVDEHIIYYSTQLTGDEMEKIGSWLSNREDKARQAKVSKLSDIIRAEFEN